MTRSIEDGCRKSGPSALGHVEEGNSAEMCTACRSLMSTMIVVSRTNSVGGTDRQKRELVTGKSACHSGGLGTGARWERESWRADWLKLMTSDADSKFALMFKCSVSCGRGIQRRSVYCVSTNRRRVVLSDSRCQHEAKPSLYRECITSQCATRWSLSEWSQVSRTKSGFTYV